MIYQGIYMYLIQKHKVFKKTAKSLKGHYKIKKNSNDIFITQLNEIQVYVSFASVDEGHIIFKEI